jgi:NADPH2:quinone reductase
VRAWLVETYGHPTLRTEVAPPGVEGDDDLVVQVDAAAVNFADGLMLAGEYQERPALPFVPGIEVAGTVVDPGRSRWRHGDRVVGLTLPGAGSWAEYARCDQSQVVAIPTRVSAVDAIGLHINAQTAWFALHRRARVTADDAVLVHAAAGGVGAMAVQLALEHGCSVIGTASADKLAAIERLGCSSVYDNRDPRWVDRVRADHGAVDVVIDPVGEAVFAGSWKLLGFEGRYVSIGFASGGVPTIKANHALVKNVSLLGLYWTRYTVEDPAAVAAAALTIFELHESGRLDPCVSVIAPLDQAAERADDVANGRTTGKTVLVPAADQHD